MYCNISGVSCIYFAITCKEPDKLYYSYTGAAELYTGNSRMITGKDKMDTGYYCLHTAKGKTYTACDNIHTGNGKRDAAKGKVYTGSNTEYLWVFVGFESGWKEGGNRNGGG